MSGNMIKFYFKPFRKRNIHNIKVKRFIFKKKKQSLMFRTVCFILVLGILLVVGEINLRPIIKNAGKNALKNELTLLLNNAVNTAVMKENIVYNDFVEIKYDNEGKINAVVTDTLYVNEFKSDLSESVAEIVAGLGDFNIKVPLGTLFGSELFSDMGYELIVSSSTYAFAVTDIKSTFDSVGINQTHHKIFVCVSLSADAYIGNYKITENVKGNVPVAETIIIGSVPDSYYSRQG